MEETIERKRMSQDYQVQFIFLLKRASVPNTALSRKKPLDTDSQEIVLGRVGKSVDTISYPTGKSIDNLKRHLQVSYNGYYPSLPN